MICHPRTQGQGGTEERGSCSTRWAAGAISQGASARGTQATWLPHIPTPLFTSLYRGLNRVQPRKSPRWSQHHLALPPPHRGNSEQNVPMRTGAGLRSLPLVRANSPVDQPWSPLHDLPQVTLRRCGRRRTCQALPACTSPPFQSQPPPPNQMRPNRSVLPLTLQALERRPGVGPGTKTAGEGTQGFPQLLRFLPEEGLLERKWVPCKCAQQTVGTQVNVTYQVTFPTKTPELA